MASIYTDDERNRRMDALRKRKRFCDKVFDLSMWAVLLIGVVTVLPSLYVGIFSGLFGGNLGQFFGGLGSLVTFVLAVLTVYKKSPLFSAAAAGFSALLLVFGHFSQFPVLFFALILLAVQYMWKKLEKEEGFPDFRISYREQSHREMHLDRQAVFRARQEGVRGDASPVQGMTDILQAAQEVSPAPQPLTGYHARGENAVPGAATPEGYLPGVMETLEEL